MQFNNIIEYIVVFWLNDFLVSTENENLNDVFSVQYIFYIKIFWEQVNFM